MTLSKAILMIYTLDISYPTSPSLSKNKKILTPHHFLLYTPIKLQKLNNRLESHKETPMPTQRKSPVSNTRLLQQITEEIATMKAIHIDIIIELKKMQSWMQRLANRVSELEKEKRDTSSTLRARAVPSGSLCEKTEGGVILYGKKIRLNNDVADVFCQLACQDGHISKEHLAALCTPQNKLNKGEHILPGSLYQRLRRLKLALNNYRADLGECIVSKRQSTKGTPLYYAFDAKRCQAILGTK